MSNPTRSRSVALLVRKDKERMQTLKDKYLGVFGLSNRKVKDKQSKRVTEEKQVAQSFWTKDKPGN